jgi:hypothetical protein
MIVRTAFLAGFVLAAFSAAQAQDDATLNHCWGDIASDLAQLETGLMGQHSRHDSIMRPPQEQGEGREGVGNVSTDQHGPLSEGGQGTHAIVVGGQIPEELGGPLVCD